MSFISFFCSRLDAFVTTRFGESRVYTSPHVIDAATYLSKTKFFPVLRGPLSSFSRYHPAFVFTSTPCSQLFVFGQIHHLADPHQADEWRVEQKDLPSKLSSCSSHSFAAQYMSNKGPQPQAWIQGGGGLGGQTTPPFAEAEYTEHRSSHK